MLRSVKISASLLACYIAAAPVYSNTTTGSTGPLSYVRLDKGWRTFDYSADFNLTRPASDPIKELTFFYDRSRGLVRIDALYQSGSKQTAQRGNVNMGINTVSQSIYGLDADCITNFSAYYFSYLFDYSIIGNYISRKSGAVNYLNEINNEEVRTSYNFGACANGFYGQFASDGRISAIGVGWAPLNAEQEQLRNLAIGLGVGICCLCYLCFFCVFCAAANADSDGDGEVVHEEVEVVEVEHHEKPDRSEAYRDQEQGPPPSHPPDYSAGGGYPTGPPPAYPPGQGPPGMVYQQQQAYPMQMGMVGPQGMTVQQTTTTVTQQQQMVGAPNMYAGGPPVMMQQQQPYMQGGPVYPPQ